MSTKNSNKSAAGLTAIVANLREAQDEAKNNPTVKQLEIGNYVTLKYSGFSRYFDIDQSYKIWDISTDRTAVRLKDSGGDLEWVKTEYLNEQDGPTKETYFTQNPAPTSIIVAVEQALENMIELHDAEVTIDLNEWIDLSSDNPRVCFGGALIVPGIDIADLGKFNMNSLPQEWRVVVDRLNDFRSGCVLSLSSDTGIILPTLNISFSGKLSEYQYKAFVAAVRLWIEEAKSSFNERVNELKAIQAQF